MLSLDRLPTEILLLILQYLPFDERVRIARVNRQFKMLSVKIISRTKTFDLSAPIFRRITTESMGKLIDIFVGNLEKVIFNDSRWQTKSEENMFSAFSENCGNNGKFLPYLLRYCPNLIHLHLHAIIDPKHICLLRQNSLKSLVLEYYGNISTQYFQNISVIFSQLERLEVSTYSGGIKIRGLEYLAKLKHLRFVKIIYKYRGSVDLDANAMELIGCKYLHCVEFDHQLNPTTVSFFTHHCSQLRQLIVENIRGIDSPNSACNFLLSIADFVQKDLSIMIKRGDSKIWKSPQVESMVTEINKYGRRLSIDIPPVMKSNMGNEWGYGKILYTSPYEYSPPPSKKWWYQNLIDWFRRLFRSIL